MKGINKHDKGKQRKPVERVILFMSHWEETPEQTQSTSERLYIPDRMKWPQVPSGGARGHVWSKRMLGLLISFNLKLNWV